MKAEMSVPSIQGKKERLLRTIRRRDLLRREIIITLVVKVLVIYALWYAFFSHPIDKTLTDSHVGNVLFGSSQSDSTSLTGSSSTPGISNLRNASIKGEK